LAEDEYLRTGIGGYFQVRFPNDWPHNDRYDFEWDQLRTDTDPFQTHDYATIAASAR
jgi:hypothetical protein